MKLPITSFWRGFIHLRHSLFVLSPTERYLVGLFTFIACTSLVAIGVQYYLSRTQAVAAPGGTYQEAMVGVPRFVNPVLAVGSDVDRDISRLLFSSLLRYNEEGNLVGDLAESYEVQNDGKRYRFVLREGLVWSDGAPLTAEDVLFTVRVIQDQKYSSPLRANWTGVTATKENDRVILFDLPTAYAPFPENATLGILPKHAWEAVAPQGFLLAEANLKPAGSGPYAFEKFERNSSGAIFSYTLVRNEKYYGTKPYLERVIFRFFETQEDAVRAYNRKVVDAIAGVDAHARGALEGGSENGLYTFTLPRYFAVFFNADKHEAFKSLKVRQALAHAIDKQALIEEVLKGMAMPTDSPIPSFMNAYDPRVTALSFDQEKARALLEEEGWRDADGDGVREKTPPSRTLRSVPSALGSGPTARSSQTSEEEGIPRLELTLSTVARSELVHAAEILSSQLGQVGVRVHVEQYELGELQQNILVPREYQMLLFGQLLSIEPDPFSFWHSSQKKDPGLNLALYENKEVDRLLEEARREQNQDVRGEKLRQFQTLVTKDVPAIFLYNPSYTYPVRKNIKGVKEGILADPSWRFGQIGQWYMNTKRQWR